MKKITLLLLFITMCFTAQAQFPEGFETAVPPTGWASFIGTNGEGTSNNWTTTSTAANGSSQAAFVEYEGVANSAEDWLVTPQFTPSVSANILTFQQRQSYTSNFGTTYTIRVSTASQTTHADFTIIDTQSETDFGTVYSTHNVDLSAYNGTPIYVAFVMEQNDGDNWYIDDVDLIPDASAPDCATNPTPADGATGVTLTGTNVTISWDAPTTGDPATGYEVFWGTTSGSLTSLGKLSATTVDITNIDLSTTYYWMIVPENVGGSATGCAEWSFTTEDPPPPPANDLPSGAIALTLDEGTACGANSITGISNQSTTDSGVAAPSCGVYGTPTERGDLWYTIMAPASGQITLNTENINGFTSVAGAFYSGTVGSLVEVDCTELGSGWPWTIGGLTAGTTYYVRVWDYGNDQTGTFDLCGYYQSCLDVTGISADVVSTDETNINWTAGLSETDWNYEWGDVEFTQGSGTTGTVSTNPTVNLTGLTDGNEYDIYIQADCGGGSTSGWVKYTWTQIAAPANDDCDNAIALTVATDGTCAITSGTTVGATASNVADDVTGTPNTDVWFSFVAYDADMTIEITNVVNQGGGTSTSTDMGMAVYSGSGCNALTWFDDSDPNTLNLTGLAINDTYYIRVYGWSSSIQYNTFDICVKGPLPPIVPSYTETFDSYPANGWTEAQGPYGATSGTSSSWREDDFANDTGHPNGKSARINVFGTGTDEYMISPIFDLSGGDAYLNFEIAYTDFSTTAAATFGADDYVALLVTEDEGANWTELARWDENTTVSNTGEAFPEMILSGYGSSVQFAFYAFSDTSNEDNNFYVDNFRVLADTVLGTDDNTLDGFKLFPTIVKQDLKFTSQNEVDEISVFNLLGQKVFSSRPNALNSSLDVSSLKGGLYIVKVKVGDKTGTYKIIKQ